MRRRIRVIYYAKSNPCFAIEKHNKLVPVGSLEIEVTVRKRKILNLWALSNTDYEINGKKVDVKKFDEVLEKLWDLLDKCELVENYTQAFGPCPEISERHYLCTKDIVEQIKSLG